MSIGTPLIVSGIVFILHFFSSTMPNVQGKVDLLDSELKHLRQSCTSSYSDIKLELMHLRKGQEAILLKLGEK